MSVESPIKDTDNWFIGEDRTFQFTVTKPDGSAQPITGWSLEWVLRRHPAEGAALITKTTPTGVAITNGSAGVCEVRIAAADTRELAPGTYFHTLARSDQGSKTVLAFGEAVLKAAATR